MRHLIIMIAMLLGSVAIYADDSIKVVKTGNTFSYVSKKKVKEEPVKTTCFFETKGKKYPIYKTSKSCFILRISARTGKEYRQYLPKEVFDSL